MIKSKELSSPQSCLNRAKDDEMVFVLLGRDAAASDAIRFWCNRRIELGKNQADDPQIVNAFDCADRMDFEPGRAHGAVRHPAGRREAVKALTLWDPWAMLVALGLKKVETRGWQTSYRGRLAIHAALRKLPYLGASADGESFHAELKACEAQLGRRIQFYPGCVLCTVELVAIEPADKVRDDLTARERIFGNYEDGRYAWFFDKVFLFPQPILAKGNRMLWNWDGNEVRR